MNFAAFERAQVAAFAYREARATGSLDCMRAICFLLRNRVKAAWGDGSWLGVIAMSHLTAASFDPFIPGEIAPNGKELQSGFRGDDRLLQMIVRDVDDIYFGNEAHDDRVRQTVCGQSAPLPGDAPGAVKGKPVPALYYCFVDRNPRPWFVENIIRQPEEHSQIGQIGKLMLYR